MVFILKTTNYKDSKLKNDNVVGNIYCGYVKDVVKNINGAFVLFDDNKKGYLSLKDFKNPVKQGDKVLVQVSGDKIKQKIIH